jgi:predicted phosphoadenosine phosphosulfate sulfurtransferase
MAGLSPDKMRVASPFNDYAKESLNLYRVIDPEMWTKLLGRVSGANFGAIYGKTKALGYRNLTPPPGHNWESYTKFLLSTLPPRVRNGYLKKFRTSIDFWHNVGGGLDNETIRDLVEKGYNIRRNGVSNYTVMKNTRIIFVGKIPDDTDDIKSSKDIPSWKRMCYCILRNDHICRFMGFGISREQQKKVDELKKKYSRVGESE